MNPVLFNTRGIALNQIPYSDTSVIARFYTEKFGIQSYIIKGARSRRSKIKPAMLQHLSLLEMVVYYRPKKELQIISEVQADYQFRSIPFDMRKSAQALFINEVVVKSLKEEEGNSPLFSFLHDAIISLDDPAKFCPDFHLNFMLEFTRYLGFFPRTNYSSGYCFDLVAGYFSASSPPHQHYINSKSADLFNRFICGIESNNPIVMHILERNMVLQYLTEFYRLHIPNFTGLSSPEVLRETFRD